MRITVSEESVSQHDASEGLPYLGLLASRKPEADHKEVAQKEFQLYFAPFFGAATW